MSIGINPLEFKVLENSEKIAILQDRVAKLSAIVIELEKQLLLNGIIKQEKK